MKKQIWMNPPLERLHSELNCRGNSKPKGFSERIGDVCFRYDLILNRITTPSLSENEIGVLFLLINSKQITADFIDRMDIEVIQSGHASAEELFSLAIRVRNWSILERLSIIEIIEKLPMKNKLSRES